MATVWFSREIFSEILSRLPVEDLLRLRCVSKAWRCLIDDPCFIELHLSRSIETETNLSVILRDTVSSLTTFPKYGHLYSVNFDSLISAGKLNHPLDLETEKGKSTKIEVLGSCNGVLAMSNPYQEIALWNPSTRKYHMLPETNVEYPPGPGSSSRPWAFKFIVYGFGYDPISDDYKLLRIVQFFKGDSDDFLNEFKVYSLRNNSWTRKKDFRYDLNNQQSHGVLVKHSLHWLIYRKPKSVTRICVVGFNLGTEKYEVLELPDSLGKKFGLCMYIHALKDCLCLIPCYSKVNVIDVWIMKKYGVKESWTKFLSVKQPEQPEVFRLYYAFPLAYSKCRNKVLLNHCGCNLVWYDLRSKRIENAGMEGVAPVSFKVEMLVGSLVPLNSNGNGNGATINKNKQDNPKTMPRKN